MEVQIISQVNKILETEQVKVITVNTLNGKIQILKNHQNLISIIDTGEVILEKQDGTKQTILVSSGFVDVNNNVITILVDQADVPDNLIADEIEKAIKRAEQSLSTSKLEPTELIVLEKMLRYEKFKQRYVGI